MSEAGRLARDPVHDPAVGGAEARLDRGLHVRGQRALRVRLQQDRRVPQLEEQASGGRYVKEFPTMPVWIINNKLSFSLARPRIERRWTRAIGCGQSSCAHQQPHHCASSTHQTLVHLGRRLGLLAELHEMRGEIGDQGG